MVCLFPEYVVESNKFIKQRESKIGVHASGKAGGFLAGGWGNHVTSELHKKGLKLHHEVAKELGVTSFREIGTDQLTYHHHAQKSSEALPPWIDGNVTLTHTDDDTAQVRGKSIDAY
jgi:hypothetical protein